MAYIRIIDDDYELAEDVMTLLKSAGHTVKHRDNIEGAVEDLAADRPDLLVLDVMFPENTSGGFDLARKIRQNDALKDLPIIMLTGVNQEFPMGFSTADIDPDWLPVQDFLEKPVDLAKLTDKVAALLDKKR